MESTKIIVGTVVTPPPTDQAEAPIQRSYIPYYIGGGICLGAGLIVGFTMLTLYVWTVPSQPAQTVTVPPRLDYPELYLTECSRSLTSSDQPSNSVYCKLGVSSIGTGVIFAKENISSDAEYIKLANSLYVALLSIEYVVAIDSRRHCPSSTNIIENICGALQAGDVTCNKVLTHNTYLYEKLFTNLTINMKLQTSGIANYNDTTDSLSVSSTDGSLLSQCQGNANLCLTGIILNTLLNDTLCT